MQYSIPSENFSFYIYFLKKIKERFRKERYCLGKGESQSVFCSCSFRAPIFPESNQCRLKWTARHHDSAVVALAQRHHHRGGGRFLTFSSSHLFPYRTCKNSDMYIHRSQYQYDCTRKPCGHRSDGQRPVCLPVSVGRSHFKLRGVPLSPHDLCLSATPSKPARPYRGSCARCGNGAAVKNPGCIAALRARWPMPATS
jgi:hypothetical protein